MSDLPTGDSGQHISWPLALPADAHRWRVTDATGSPVLDVAPECSGKAIDRIRSEVVRAANIGHAIAVKGPLAPFIECVALLDPDAEAETIVQAITFIEDAQRQLRKICAEAKDVLLTKLIESGQSVTVGTTRYYVGEEKDIKPRDLRRAFEAAMEASGGDIDLLVSALSSNALKVGACRKLLGDRFEEHFETTVEMVLKDGKPSKVQKLISLDTRFAE